MKLSPAAQLVLAIGEAEARHLESPELDPEHLLIGVLKAVDMDTRPDGVSAEEWASAQGEIRALAAHWSRSRVNPVQMRRRLRYLVSQAGGGGFGGEQSPRCRKALDDAADRAGDDEVDLVELLEACLDQAGEVSGKLLEEFAVAKQALVPDATSVAEPVHETPMERRFEESPLARYGRDLTAMARAGKLNPVIGRREEMKDVARILSQSIRNNAMLVGDAGVGKTAVVEGLAQYAAREDAHPSVRDYHIVEITMVSLLAGSMGSSDIAGRFMEMLKMAREDPKLVLFFDEFHTMAGAGDILKPALARGEIHCVGATTVSEFQKHVEVDSALARRFQKVWIGEPSRDETVQILQGLRPKLAEHHGMEIPDETLEAAVDFTMRFVPAGRLPDKAIILLDQACAQHRLMTFTPGEAPAPAALTVEAVAQAAAKQAQLPVSRILAAGAADLADVERRLAERVIGQPKAVATLAGAVQLIGTGLEQEGKPFVVMFAGPSGTGKTELAKALSAVMFGEDDRLITLDMTRFRERHHRAELIGSPVGYVGSDETPKWITEFERQPDSVVLLDEVEKAHREVLTVFMPVFDEGRLETAKGKVADFSHAIFVLTSNLGTAHQEARLGIDVGAYEAAEDRTAREAREFEYQVRQAISQRLMPEILGRIREVVVFQPLTREALYEILDLHLGKLNRRRGFMERDIEVALDDSARDFLIEQGYSTEAGARELIRTLERHVVNPLAAALVSGEVSAGNHLVCRREGDGIAFDVGAAEALSTIVLPPRDDTEGGSP